MNQDRIISISKPNDSIQNIVYIMHNAFRVKNNHALFHALSYQKEVNLIMVYPFDKNERTLSFFNSNISNYNESFGRYFTKIKVLKRNELFKVVFPKGTHIIMDMYYLYEEKKLYEEVLEISKIHQCSLDLVETNVLVPVTEASNKEEYSARTIRSKIDKKISLFQDSVLNHEVLLKGEINATACLTDFITNKLEYYHLSNHPEEVVTSGLSPYLKYGFISPLTIYEAVSIIESPNKESFLEELIIRRELAYNFVLYNEKYFQFEHITYPWAYNSMQKHIGDKRMYVYDKETYIQCNTHDEYFNTAMKEMIYLGKMHGYMRMYWAKKIIEWSPSYKEAFNIIIYLNNHYFIDGNTPNGFAGVAWCFGKHDRAWKEREIFGKLRYMNKNGLERKFNMEKYILRVEKEVANYEN